MLLPEGDARVAGAPAEFGEHMKAVIRARFGRMLGADVALLDSPEGLEQLSRRVLARVRASYAGVWEVFPALDEPAGIAAR